MLVQEVIQTLNEFWREQGCILWQPYHTEVGAGTSNPATFLRAVGPEPWWVAYPEPSIRPDDGRYAENPNRLQHYYQYQVILKPSPPNVQELFLQSLEALGLDLTRHDFRFVEDNWQSPSLGAWGLGWEAWLDGMEVLQFTYFQECGGMKLDVRACELTYGVERIAMYLQEVESVFDLVWAPSGITYGDIFRSQEVEYCKYNFEEADIERLFHTFDAFEAEAQRLLDEGLVLPAYDHTLRLSHLFNVLDARGALSVTERGRFLLRCRGVAEGCARAFHAQREEMGFPLCRLTFQAPAESEPLPEPDRAAFNATDTLLLEVGVEELPHRDVRAVLDQGAALFTKLLDDHELEHGAVEVYAAPRRIGVLVRDCAARQRDVSKEVRGPKRQAAQDKDGNWTMPAKKFAEGNGVTVDDIYFQDTGKGEYCFVKQQKKGKHIVKLLSEVVEQFLRGLQFGRTMGWEDTTAAFSRPVRWLVALHGANPVPVTWTLREENDLGPARVLVSGAESQGHRRLGGGPFTIPSADAYLSSLRDHLVLAGRDERMRALRDGVAACAAQMGLTAEEDDDLYDEVCDLVEWPEPIVCEIPEEALSLPEPIVITPMKVHQRYIPLRDADGVMSRHFIAVANGDHGDEGRAQIREGNEKVLNARLRDAKYFWDTDIRTPLRRFGERLENVMFHQKLGTVADKVNRLRDLYFTLHESLPGVKDATMEEVFLLMKADLTTQMVSEFSSLEGVVGMLYAREQGVDEEVARAILDHRLPRRAGDAMPQGLPGLIAGLLDRLDTLAGYFGIGIRPKGTSDPFGLRRNTLGLLAVIQHATLDIDLETFARAAIANYGDLVANPDTALNALLGFVENRLEAMARDQGHAHDYVAAALAVHYRKPNQFFACLDALASLDAGQVQALAEQAKRMGRIVKEPADAVRPELLTEPEKPLYDLCTREDSRLRELVSRHEFDAAFSEVLGWVPIINDYFEQVLVNDEDDAVRMNRHAMLRDVLRDITAPADFTKIEKREA